MYVHECQTNPPIWGSDDDHGWWHTLVGTHMQWPKKYTRGQADLLVPFFFFSSPRSPSTRKSMLSIVPYWNSLRAWRWCLLVRLLPKSGPSPSTSPSSSSSKWQANTYTYIHLYVHVHTTLVATSWRLHRQIIAHWLILSLSRLVD